MIPIRKPVLIPSGFPQTPVRPLPKSTGQAGMLGTVLTVTAGNRSDMAENAKAPLHICTVPSPTGRVRAAGISVGNATTQTSERGLVRTDGPKGGNSFEVYIERSYSHATPNAVKPGGNPLKGKLRKAFKGMRGTCL